MSVLRIPTEVVSAMEIAIAELRTAAAELDLRAEDVAGKLKENIPWWRWWKRVKLYRQARELNLKYMYLERHFLYAQGLDGREWFKHTVFAPGLWTG
jgi:N-acetylated-alpha-linked acidic dipeptidase